MAQDFKKSNRRGWQIAGAAVLAVILLGFVIPQVRASVSAWLGLSVAPSNQMPAPANTLVAVQTPPPASTLEAATPEQAAGSSPAPAQTAAPEGIPADVSELSAQAGWNVLTPSWLPQGYQYQDAYFDTNLKMLILTYLAKANLTSTPNPTLTTTELITLLQAQKNDFPPMQVAPAASVTDVQVNGQPAAYAVGAWDTSFVPNTQEPNGGQMVSTWRNDLPVKNLYWQVGDIYLTLTTGDPAVSQQDMIDMAASVQAR